MDINLILNRPRISDSEIEGQMDFAGLIRKHQKQRTEERQMRNMADAKIVCLFTGQEFNNDPINEQENETIITF